MTNVEDVLGIKPIANAVEKTVNEAFEYLGLVCKPAAQELGLLWKDKVAAQRTATAAKIALASKRQSEEYNIPDDVPANFSIASRVLNEGSWTQDERLIDMWGGLITSSRTKSGTDDTNVIHINKLSQMTAFGASIFEYACTHSELEAITPDLMLAKRNFMQTNDLCDAIGSSDLVRIDFELDNLRHIGVFEPDSGFGPDAPQAVVITPSALGLHLYTRCKGFSGKPMDYFKVTYKKPDTVK